MLKMSLTDFLGLIMAVVWLLLSGCAVRPAGPGPVVEGDVSGRAGIGDDHSRVELMFTTDDRRHIHDYYYREREHYRDYDDDYSGKKKNRKHLPPGLGKRDELPPGLQKQIRRNGQLPPGLQGRHLPGDLERRLSPLPANYIRLQVGRDIVLLDQRTRITVDVIKNIFP